jgi:hypothetical protein
MSKMLIVILIYHGHKPIGLGSLISIESCFYTKILKLYRISDAAV